MCDGGKIQIALVDAHLFKIRRQRVQELYQPPAVIRVQRMVWRRKDKVWALFTGGGDGLPGADAESLCRNGFCQDNAVTAALIPADDGGNLA